MYEHSIDRHSQELSNIERAALFLEDRRFFIHSGVEFRSIPRLLRRMLRGRRPGGISTIDQQVVRIATRKTERTIGRKTREMLLAYALNTHSSKRDILYYYLHNAYFGYKLSGCELASRHIFGCTASDLSYRQACFVASLLPLPLPRQVYELCQSGVFSSPCDPSDIFANIQVSKLKWAPRIEFRFNIALQGQGFTPKSRKSRKEYEIDSR